jgi:hypothetical protein
MKTINIATEFSTLPGPRYIEEGDNSGELFRDRILEPRFLEAEGADEPLRVELDGVEFGYPTSFMEEAFGGLARKHGVDRVLTRLQFVSRDEPLLIQEVTRYIRNANESKPPARRK